MIEITNLADCCGCAACYHRCPKHCITLQEDEEGFLYPKVDKDTCIDCGLCSKVCHELHPYEAKLQLKVYAAINKDEEIRLKSSSGGIFYLLAEKTIAEGGVVFGAKFDEDWQVYITYAETIEGVRPFMGSKYVQARTENSYKDAERFLKEGRKVLYSGAPCQVAGLKHYLRKEYENLTTVDFVCHGVPSPKVWGLYLKEVTEAFKNIGDIKFRNKRNGWIRFNFNLTYLERGNSVSLSSFHGDNHYMRAFLGNLILRPSCYNCQAKGGRSHSDITIADYWGVGEYHPNMNDNKGTSLVLVNTLKGFAALDWEKVRFEESTYEQALRYNSSMAHSVKPHRRRKKFFTKINTANSVTHFIDLMLRPSMKQRMEYYLYKFKCLATKLLTNINGGGESPNNVYSANFPTCPNTSSISTHLDISSSKISSISFRSKRYGKDSRMEIIYRETNPN